MRLNLGCGRDIREGWVNVDYEAGPGVDLVLDLDEGRLPFPSSSVDEVYASHVLEHLLHWERLVIEAHRVLKPRGKLEIVVPYGYRWNSAYHVRYFLPVTIETFCVKYERDLIDEVHSHDFPQFPVHPPQVSFQARDLFFIVKQHLHYKVFGRWHHVPIGWRYCIHWILEKVGP